MTLAHWIELVLVALSAPALVFPTLMPQLTELALVALALWWLGELVVRRRPPVGPLNGAILVWAIMVGIGTLVTAYPEVTLPKVTNLVLGLAVWRLLGRLPATRRTIRWSKTILAMMGFAILVLGLLSVRWTQKIPLLAPTVAEIPVKLVALPEAPQAGVNANQLGGALTLFLPWALSELIGALANAAPQSSRSARAGRAAIAALGFLVFGAALILTQSRSAWMGAAIGTLSLIALWGLTAKRRQWRILTLTLVATILIGALTAGWIMGGQRLMIWWEAATTAGMETMAGSVSLSGRLDIWSRARYVIQDFVLTGCGLGAYREVIQLRYPLFGVSPMSDVAHAHNIFLQIAVDTGIPGLIAYVALIGLAAAMAWRTARARHEHRGLMLGLLGGLVALHVYSLTDALAPGSKPSLVLWMTLGIIEMVARAEPTRLETATLAQR